MIDYKQLLKDMFRDIYEAPGVSEEAIEKYFSPEYRQTINNHTLSLDEVIENLKEMKITQLSHLINIKHILIDKDKLSTVHFIDREQTNGKRFKAKVISFWQMANNQFISCDELVMPL